MAAIMVAMSFFNVSPRPDKDHVLNEIRAATISNSFKVEHVAVLKTMECEIMKHMNSSTNLRLNGWDYSNESTPTDVVRASADGPVDVSCFDPFGADCDSVEQFKKEGNERVKKDNYNFFELHVPMGYQSALNGVYHYVVCLDNIAEKSEANFVACSNKGNAGGGGNSTSDSGTQGDSGTPVGADTTGDEDETGEPDTSGNSSATSSTKSYKRYLVSFAPIPEKWLAKPDKTTPLPIMANLLARDEAVGTTYGWTECENGSNCILRGRNARHGYVKKKGTETHQADENGVRTGYVRDITVTTNQTETTTNAEGNEVETPKKQVMQVFEYELLDKDSKLFDNTKFQEICGSQPCMFAYELFPVTDTAYHCHNLMDPDHKKTNCPSGAKGKSCRLKKAQGNNGGQGNQNGDQNGQGDQNGDQNGDQSGSQDGQGDQSGQDANGQQGL